MTILLIYKISVFLHYKSFFVFNCINMSNNQIPPQLPPEAPQQVPPQMPQYQPNPNWNNPKPPKKGASVWKILLIILACFIGLGIIATMCDDNKNGLSSNSNLDEKTSKWQEIAIKDSTNLNNGYFSTSQMSDFDTFVKRFKELEIISLKHTPKEVTDSSVIKFVNRNSYNALGMLNDSITNYRNQYTKILEDKLWPDNIKVKTQNGGKTLWLIGGFFANNRNILEFQKASEPMFKALGYKRICYKWADISSAEYTYYDLDK